MMQIYDHRRYSELPGLQGYLSRSLYFAEYFILTGKIQNAGERGKSISDCEEKYKDKEAPASH